MFTKISLKKMSPLTKIAAGWVVMLGCGFGGGWTLADTSWARPYPLVVILVGGFAALRVGRLIDECTSVDHGEDKKPWYVWFFFAGLGLVLGLWGVLHNPPVHSEAYVSFRVLLSMAGAGMVIMSSLVVAVGIAEKYLNEDYEHCNTIKSKNKKNLPWWISATCSAFIVANVGITGLNLAVRYQSDPNTVWGLWNSKNIAEQQYKIGKLDKAEFEKRMGFLEKLRKQQAQKQIAQTLLPQDSLVKDKNT